MTTTNDLFQRWAKKSETPQFAPSVKKAVVYTRVSSKEQYDKNLSLDWQRKAIEEFASRNGFEIMNFYGGTYESAKTDGRKEFQHMLEFIKKQKGKVSHILVYLLDRFSRTGGGAIKLAQDLREKYGVTIIAVTQPIDTSNPGGVFQQNMQFLFSQYDNELRKQRAVAGIKEKLERGIWCIKPPMGYDILRSNGERKIVVNKEGKLLRKAFEWKAVGKKSEEILGELKASGLKIYKQKLSQIFSNPFYCGLIANKMLNGKLVEGTHEKLISKELFLKVNGVRQASGGKYGVAHQKEQASIPLKVFMKCEQCGEGYSGYVVKAKNIWYYKCRRKGCCANKNAKQVNEAFEEFLTSYQIKEKYLPLLIDELMDMIEGLNESNKERQTELKSSLSDVQEKIDTVEEKYFVSGEMGKETYEKLLAKFGKEKEQILSSFAACATSTSNMDLIVESAVTYSLKLATEWASRPVKLKERLQKLIFPEGVSYSVKTGAFRTEKANLVFALNRGLNSVSEDDKTGQGGLKATLSSLVGWTGFEPATPCTPCKCATGLRHHPNGCKFKCNVNYSA
jgi:site-specific DNA recombinase